MNIAHLIDQIHQDLLAQDAQAVRAPCSEQQIEHLNARFRFRFRQDLPAAYQEVLRRCDGLRYNGLVLWPAMAGGGFPEDLVAANDHLRKTVAPGYVYFGQVGEELLACDKEGRYCTVDLEAQTVWAVFDSGDELIRFALEKAWLPV